MPECPNCTDGTQMEPVFAFGERKRTCPECGYTEPDA